MKSILFRCQSTHGSVSFDWFFQRFFAFFLPFFCRFGPKNRSKPVSDSLGWTGSQFPAVLFFLLKMNCKTAPSWPKHFFHKIPPKPSPVFHPNYKQNNNKYLAWERAPTPACHPWDELEIKKTAPGRINKKKTYRCWRGSLLPRQPGHFCFLIC